MCLIVVGGGRREGGGVNCKFWGKKPLRSFDYYKRMT